LSESPLNTVTPSLGDRSGLWNLNFILVWLSNFSVLLTFYCLIPTLPIYIQEYGGSERTAGLALACLTAAAIVSRPFTGWALDHCGRRLLLLSVLLVYLLPAVIYTAMISLPAACAQDHSGNWLGHTEHFGKHCGLRYYTARQTGGGTWLLWPVHRHFAGGCAGHRPVANRQVFFSGFICCC